jgi:hypothetical protein
VLFERLLDSAHVAGSCRWVLFLGVEFVGSWPRSIEKITDRCSALYVIYVMGSRDRDGPRLLAQTTSDTWRVVGDELLHVAGINGSLGHKIHSSSNAARAALRLQQMRHTDREK